MTATTPAEAGTLEKSLYPLRQCVGRKWLPVARKKHCTVIKCADQLRAKLAHILLNPRRGPLPDRYHALLSPLPVTDSQRSALAIQIA